MTFTRLSNLAMYWAASILLIYTAIGSNRIFYIFRFVRTRILSIMKKALFIFVIISALFSSCKKTDTATITGNVPPPDHTIDSSKLIIYVNKAYINMLG